jgi:hypothetical protein
MNDPHSPRHDLPRRPLRLQPLPRPGRRADSPADAAEAPPGDGSWIHEWSQPAPALSTDA